MELTTPISFTYEKSSLSTTRVRQRLQDLMGSDVIRLNDRRYFEKLSTKLNQEYETTMDKQENARADAEKERLRRLKLEGIIEDKTDYRSIIVKDKQKKKGKKKRKKTKRKSREDVDYNKEISRIMDKGDTSKTSEYSDDGEEEDDNKEDDVLTQIQIDSGSRPTSSAHRRSLSPRQRSSHSAHRKPSTTQQNSTSQVRSESRGSFHRASSATSRDDIQPTEAQDIPPPHHEGALRQYHSSRRKRVQSALPRYSTDRISDSKGNESDDVNRDETRSLPGDLNESRRKKQQGKFSIVDPPLIVELKHEETVAGLYDIADKLIYPVATKAEEERMYREYSKSRNVKPKQKKMK